MQLSVRLCSDVVHTNVEACLSSEQFQSNDSHVIIGFSIMLYSMFDAKVSYSADQNLKVNYIKQHSLSE